MKRLLCATLLCTLCAGLAGCGGTDSTSGESSGLSSDSSAETDLTPEPSFQDSSEEDAADEALPQKNTSDSAESYSDAPEASTDNVIDVYHEIQDFEIIYQEPELPTGCEITALTMVLHYYGFDVDKVTMATEYLPTEPYELWTDSDGELHGPDLRNYFIGAPTDVGYTCGTGAIATAADTYLEDAGSSMHAVSLLGAAPEELYAYVNDDTPVVVWVTIDMADRREAEGWYTDDNTWVDWSTNDHGAVLIGYTDSTVTIADPINGYEIYDKSQFESVYLSRGSQAVILE